jgi:hypothetical protein
MKREIRCESGAIPVAVKVASQNPSQEGLKKNLINCHCLAKEMGRL